VSSDDPAPGHPHRPDARGDGDGWVECDLGHAHWGLFGAAGLLLHRDGTGERQVLLQHRAEWSHHGGTWGLLGGARQSQESALEAALREAREEGGVPADAVRPEGEYDDDHGGWSYATVIAHAVEVVLAHPTGRESIDVAWYPVDSLGDLALHPGFSVVWPLLRPAIAGLSLVVDAANVVGSRPDGWWRDRAGAARRLVHSCRSLATAGIAAADVPEDSGAADLAHWWPYITVVVEGAARPAADLDSALVSVVPSGGSGDDTIVAEAKAASGARVLVVTADRALRARCEQIGAAVVGPRWLLGLVDRLGG
jgi:8-oxo-dGTP pyrophosphatase MutT (NUDIX family)